MSTMRCRMKLSYRVIQDPTKLITGWLEEHIISGNVVVCKQSWLKKRKRYFTLATLPCCRAYCCLHYWSRLNWNLHILQFLQWICLQKNLHYFSISSSIIVWWSSWSPAVECSSSFLSISSNHEFSTNHQYGCLVDFFELQFSIIVHWWIIPIIYLIYQNLSLGQQQLCVSSKKC